jgi:hypothetical protein
MPRSALLTSLIPDDTNPLGTDFIGGAEPLPAQPGASGQVVPGTDFAGGAMPLPVEATEEHGW